MRIAVSIGLTLLTGCAHRTVSWVESSSAVVTEEVAQVAVLSTDDDCVSVERALRGYLLERGVSVDAAAPVQLLLDDCEVDIQSDLELQVVDPLFNESQGADGLRRVALAGSGSAKLQVIGVAGAPTVLLARVARDETSGWRQKPDDAVARGVGLERELVALLAEDLAQQVRPVEVQRRRRAFRKAAPGSAEEILNAAVDAERAGNVEEALDLAREAYVRKPTWWALEYVDQLEARAGCSTEVVEHVGTW